MPDTRLSLVIGGARSGKSAEAERIVTGLPAPWLYVATAQAFDDEMRDRIALHRERRGQGWQTIEAPLALAQTLATAPTDQPVLVDCLTLWLSNLMLGEHDIDAAGAELENVLAAPRGPWVLVSNEVGMGIVPDNELARRFRDAAGRLNQRVAALSDTVILTVAGLPVRIKG